jgi:hypothetical protein
MTMVETMRETMREATVMESETMAGTVELRDLEQREAPTMLPMTMTMTMTEHWDSYS